MPALRSRASAAALLLLILAACSGRGFGRQYEYEEQLYLYADGSATVVINASIVSLIALRGLPLDGDPRARIDRDQVRAMVEEPGVEIARVSRPWRRSGRPFIQISVKTDAVEKLGGTKLLGWSRYSTRYSMTATNEQTREYRQVVGTSSAQGPRSSAWNGSELVAFKLHLPNRIRYQNVRLLETNEPGTVERGNILTWEQRLSDRLEGKPIDMQVTMDSGSILYTTLALFVVSFASAMLLLGAIVWTIVRRGRQRRTVS